MRTLSFSAELGVNPRFDAERNGVPAVTLSEMGRVM